MLIKQLSIFLENKKGRFTEVAKILGEAGVNMSAFTVAENSDFCILRLIVSDTEKAISVLREKLYAVSVADVVCLHCPNQPPGGFRRQRPKNSIITPNSGLKISEREFTDNNLRTIIFCASCRQRL